MDDRVDQLMAEGEPRMRDLGRRLCELILRIYPDAVITVDDARVGFGRGTGYKGLVFVVSLHRAYVTLGVAGAAELPDPAGLLEGTGKVHGHVKLRQGSDLDRPELRELMKAAVARQQ